VTPALGWGLLGLFVVLVGVFDALLIRKGRKSMSRWMSELAFKRPIAVFLLGVLIGVFAAHFWFPLDACLEAVKEGTL
jgi:hypothetical protein